MIHDTGSAAISFKYCHGLMAFAGDSAEERIAQEKQLLRDEISRTKVGDKGGFDQQAGPFFIYVVLPIVLLFAIVGIVRGRS
jgi:hypothetical protein